MSGWDYRNRVLGDIDAQGQTSAVDVGKTLLEEPGIQVADVEENAVIPRRLHFRIYGARNDIAKGQIFQRMIFLHESPATAVYESSPFASDRFGDEKVFRRRMVEARWMKLNEFQVRKLSACLVGYGEPVSGGDVRIAGIEIDFAGPARAQQHGVRRKRVDLVCGCVEDVGAPANVLLVEVERTGFHGMMLDYEIQHHVVFENGDIRV